MTRKESRAVLEIRPALSVAGWKTGRDLDILTPTEKSEIAEVVILPEGDPHALAALALHGQPFGFTWDDVELLRMFGNGDPMPHIRQQCNDLADRIAALLPPRE